MHINNMQAVAQHLLDTINKALPLLQQIHDADASIRPAPNKWSYKEIIGHLIDSATNNQQKFVRCIQQSGVHMPPYEQDPWVAIQHYNDAGWKDILNAWYAMNEHIAHIMKHIPQDSLQNEIYIGDKGPYTLDFIVRDYPEHLKHHLKAILSTADFLSNEFNMVY
jgi:hypothetical protein